MKIKLLFIMSFLVVAFFSCDKKINRDLPQCIEDIVNDSTLYEPIQTIKVQNIKGELHYWLNTDARHYDGIEIIVNQTCDTVCSYCGECYPAKCIDNYDDEDWVIIWEKK